MWKPFVIKTCGLSSISCDNFIACPYLPWTITSPGLESTERILKSALSLAVKDNCPVLGVLYIDIGLP